MSGNSFKYKYLGKNIGLMTLSSFTTKILQFFLVPLYTNILSTEEYGTYDLIITTIGVLLPILTFNIQESTLRFALDKNYNKRAIVSISTKYFALSTLFNAFLLSINYILCISKTIKDYTLFFLLVFTLQALSGILSSYARGLEKIRDLSLSSIVASVITIVCNITFLVVFKWGLIGYMVANMIGPAVQCVFLISSTNFLQSLGRSIEYSKEQSEMLSYSKPMIANSVGWWINNLADRYAVILFWGLSENGIYSVASKIPSIMNIVQSIFNQAWTLSVVKDYDSEDKSGFFSKTYAVYNYLMTCCCSIIIMADKILAKLLYAKDFFVAWKYVPWLTIAILFGALSGYLGGFFSAVKNSKIYAQSTMAGAVCNLILNFILIPIFGTMGAAIATSISYSIIWIFRLFHSRTYIKLEIHLISHCISYAVLVIQTLVMYFMDGLYLYCFEFMLFVVILGLHKQELLLISGKIKRIICKS